MKLETSGYRVARAYDGNEAWQRIREEKPRVMLLDVMMPKKDGYTLCQEIKTDEGFKDIRVILLTAVGAAVPSTSYTHKDGMTTLADDYVPKPIDLDSLMDLVAEYAG
jgi:CheY-like chemotaxis protein